MTNNAQETITPCMINRWDLSQWDGPAPERQFLLATLFPMSAVSALTTIGHLEPLLVLMHLGLQVAADQPQKTLLGHPVTEQGTAIIFSTTHDQSGIHWILNQLRRTLPQGLSEAQNERIHLIPLSETTQAQPFLVKRTPEGHTVTTELFEQLLQQLKTIPNLKLVAFDDMFSLLPEGRRSREHTLRFAVGQLARIAAETDASVIVGDNISCAPAKNGYVDAVDQITHMVENNTGLYRIARCVYALWENRNKRYQGAMIKNNYGPPNDTIRDYVVSPEGLLMACH